MKVLLDTVLILATISSSILIGQAIAEIRVRTKRWLQWRAVRRDMAARKIRGKR